MAIMDTERGLLNLAMVDIMAKLMFMKIVSMVLLDTMVGMDMARGLLRLNLVMDMAILLVMTTESRDFMATMAMARGLLSQAMATLPVISTVV